MLVIDKSLEVLKNLSPMYHNDFGNIINYAHIYSAFQKVGFKNKFEIDSELIRLESGGFIKICRLSDKYGKFIIGVK